MQLIFIAETFTSTPQNVRAEVGDKVRFNCSINSVFKEHSIFLVWEYQLAGADHPLTVVIDTDLPHPE